MNIVPNPNKFAKYRARRKENGKHERESKRDRG